MGSKNELKEIDIKNCTCYYVDDTQPAWMHLRCIFETSHAASQRHLKES